MEQLICENITKNYKSKDALDSVNLTLEKGKIYGLIGRNGAGKTTLLSILSAQNPPSEGSVVLETEEGRLSVWENEKALSHICFSRELNVGKNTALSATKVKDYLRTASVYLPHWDQELADELIRKFHLEGLEQHLPAHLSGGQQQRVALARALVIEPSVLLFDEPLSNLDAKLRVTMRTEIRKIQQKVGITAIYVTHDQSEAMSISDKIIIMSQGRVEQIGTPREIYYHPSSRFVADFIGEANFLDAKVKSVSGEKAVIDVVGQELEVNNFAHADSGADATLVIRPEGATLAEQGLLEATVSLSTFMGSYQYYEVMVGNMMIQITDYNPVNRRIYEVGEKAYLDFDPKGVYILSAG